MATFQNYKCERCGYTITTAPSGKYDLLSGEHRTYLCKHCRDIVSVNESIKWKSISYSPQIGITVFICKL